MRRDDRGAAMVEFAIVGVLLVLFVFGIIVFGLLLSFKQDVTRAAAEGARVGAVALPGPGSSGAGDARLEAAEVATQDAVASFGRSCGPEDPALICDIRINACDNDPASECLTVRLEYDYANHPLIIDPPFLSAALPDVVASESVVRVNR